MYVVHIWYWDVFTQPCKFAQDNGLGLKEREPEIVQQEERLKVQVCCVLSKSCFCMPDKIFATFIIRAYVAALVSAFFIAKPVS